LFRFEHPDYLYALAIIPVVLVLFVLAQMARRRAIRRLGDADLVAQMMPKASKYKHPLKAGLFLLGLAFLVVGWANPQWGTKKEKVKVKSVDVYIALDVSQSMLAEDIAPNRLERAKRFASELVEQLKGNRIGLIVFAGNAYLQMPLTTDYAAAQLFLKTANTEMVPTQGTAIGEAIKLARKSMDDADKSHKALLIITDGESHDEGATEAAEAAHEAGLLIFTIGVGTPQGSKIPVFYNGQRGFKVDENGQEVVTRLNEAMLADLAKSGGGTYFNISAGDQVIGALQSHIEQLEKKEREMRSFEDYESYFQYFIGLALLLFLVEFIISYRTNRWLEGKDIFG